MCGTIAIPNKVKPFLKWPGGKRWLAEDIASIIRPRLAGTYFEPFLGGGAVFFALHPLRATLSDLNGDLINAFQHVRDRPRQLLQRLRPIPVTPDTYYRIRAAFPKSPLGRAVRFLYLNRTAFGGIYRENRAGRFNVPYGGGSRTPEPLWRDRLVDNAANVLRRVSLLRSDFQRIVDTASEGDVVYCDPTYTVAHENNCFVRYNERNFSWGDQQRLAAAAMRARGRGAVVIISNAAHRDLLALYPGIRPLKLERVSSVSPTVEARRRVHEYLFTVYP